MYQCPNCGEWLTGDGYTVTYHCPNAEVPQDAAPDDRPIFCDLSEGEVAAILWAEAEDATLMKIFLDEQHARNE